MFTSLVILNIAIMDTAAMAAMDNMTVVTNLATHSLMCMLIQPGISLTLITIILHMVPILIPDIASTAATAQILAAH